MKKWLPLTIFIFLLTFVNPSVAQFYFLDDAKENLEIEFLKPKIESSVNETFFNMVKIKNPSDRKTSFMTNFSYPNGWNFIGTNNQRIDLAAHDSILLPFRAAPSIMAKGDIGYTIVASLSDLSGNLIKNQYSFINIPRIKKVHIKPKNRLLYLTSGKKNTEMELLLVNNGNTDENFYLEFDFSPTLASNDSRDNYFQDEIFVPPYSDTVYRLPIHLVPDANTYDKKYHRTQMKVSTQDTSYQTSFWVKELNKKVYNPVPDPYKMLSMELNLQDLFSERTPSFSFYIYGNLLFKNDHSFHYYLQTFNESFFKTPYQSSRFLLEYKKGPFSVQIGDVSGNFYQDNFGRGATLSFIKNKTNVRALASKSLGIEQYTGGVELTQNFKFVPLRVGYSIIKNKKEKFDSHVGFFGLNKNFKKLGNISATFVAGIFDAERLSEKPLGMGGLFSYNNRIKNTQLQLQASYFNTKIYGNQNGKIQVNGNVFHPLAQGRYLTANYNLNSYGPVSLLDTIKHIRGIYNRQQIKVLYNQLLKNRITFSLGPQYITQESNQFYYRLKNPFFTHSYYLHSSLRYRTANTRTILSLRAEPGMTMVSPSFHEYDSLATHKLWFNANLSANLASRIWGFYLSFYYGPYSVAQQHQYHISNFYSQNLQVMPYLDLFLIKKYLRFNSRLNYTYDIMSKANRMNFSNELTGYIGHTWQLSFLANLNYQATKDLITDEIESYNSAFFEVRLRKDFLINQPRYQYHDLEVIFFKDLDGNRVKTDDEPGIRNVLFSIKQDDRPEFQSEDVGAYFNPLELLSDLKGKVIYENIPNGFYTIEYHPIGEVKGAFTSEVSVQNIHIDKDKKLYIPFLENNKIFGKVILKRSKLSNLGTVSVGNIKVTAEDSKGKKHSTLTNNEGDFVIYVPNVDKYKVKVNNIFFENFDLEQNNYEVQLNGYRQFEVNFIFNEKKRKINFTSTYEYDVTKERQGIEIVRRTNLSGTVKDATTLNPISANVRVINKEGKEITSGTTNIKNGMYALSFVAGDDYAIEVSADDYWFFSESLYNKQLITFKNLEKDVLLKSITVGSIIPMKALLFDAGSTKIPVIAFPELERLMKVLKKNPSIKIAVHGHSDDLEMLESKNKDLSLQRAKNVATYLIANGYNRVTYMGHDNKKPLSNNDTEDGRQMNRRVEIVVIGR